MAEAQLAHAVVATDISPATADPTTKDIRRAILEQFESEVTPVAITRFRSDFVIQFDNQEERYFCILYGA